MLDGQTIYHHCMFPVSQYVCLQMQYGLHTSLQPPEYQQHLFHIIGYLSDSSGYLSEAVRSIERDYTTGYDFFWVSIHIRQSNIVWNPIWSHRKAHGIISTIAILPLWWYLVNVRWTDNIPSLHVSSESICVFSNAIWSPHQLTATRMLTIPCPASSNAFLKPSGEWKEFIPLDMISAGSPYI